MNHQYLIIKLDHLLLNNVRKWNQSKDQGKNLFAKKRKQRIYSPCFEGSSQKRKLHNNIVEIKTIPFVCGQLRVGTSMFYIINNSNSILT